MDDDDTIVRHHHSDPYTVNPPVGTVTGSNSDFAMIFANVNTANLSTAQHNLWLA